jgi:phospholipid/cholesterol/gamma-HCH transport system substrate-binding protein
MDLHYKQEVTVGALVVSGIAIFVLGSMWLGGRSMKPGESQVQVRFANVGNLKRGNPVKVSGVTLGSVQEIEFQSMGKVLVSLSLDPRIVPRSDATAQMASVGLVGDLQINFDPGTAADPLRAGTVIQGTQERGLMTVGQELADQAKGVLTGVQDVANKQLADDLHNTLTSIRRLADTYGNTKTGPSAELTTTLQSLQGVSRRLDSTLADPAIKRTIAQTESLTIRFNKLADQLAGTGTRIDSILGKVNRGEGTVGRAMNDSTLYVQLRDLSASLKAFVDDLRKNPGKISVQVKLF